MSQGDNDMNNKSWQIRHAGGNYWLLDMEQDGLEYKFPMSLNDSGMFIYQRLADGKSVEEIADEMSSSFVISKEEAAADVKDFVKQMVKKGIIREG